MPKRRSDTNLLVPWEVVVTVTTYFSHCIDEDNKKKTVTKSEQKWRPLKLSRSTKMPKIESEKIDYSHRPCSRPAPWGKIESVRTHSEVIEQFDSFSLLKLLFLVKNLHCWLPNDTQKPRKNLRNGGFSTPLTCMKSSTLNGTYAKVRASLATALLRGNSSIRRLYESLLVRGPSLKRWRFGPTRGNKGLTLPTFSLTYEKQLWLGRTEQKRVKLDENEQRVFCLWLPWHRDIVFKKPAV